jgi:hypothetical protein
MRDELTTAEKRLAATRTELAGLEQRKQQIAIDETAARRAQESRSEAEKALALVQEQITNFQQRRDNTSAELDDLRRRLDDENRRLQELRAASNPSTPPALAEPALQPRVSAPGPTSSGARPIAGPTRLVPRPPANTAQGPRHSRKERMPPWKPRNSSFLRSSC